MTRADIVVAIPKANRGICYPLADRSVNQAIARAISEGLTVGWAETDSALLPVNRNMAVDKARLFDPKWIVFIDTDMVVPNMLIPALMKHDKDIVAALAVRRAIPYDPVAYKKNKENWYDPIIDLPENQLVKVDAAGTGVMLIKMSVFDKIPKPYFAAPDYGTEVLGEDIYFCAKAKESGFDVYMDTTVQCGHIGDYIYTYQDFLDYKKLKESNDSRPVDFSSHLAPSGTLH